MILDEPTNDLDLETIRLIEDFLSEWPGTLIVVSHDRTFLSQTTDRLLEVRPDGSVGDIPGGIDMWIARSLKVGLDDDTRADSDAPAGASNAKLAREAGKDVSRLERQIAKMAEKIAATSDYEEAGRLTKDMDALRQQLTEAEERWLRLSSS